MMNFKSSVSAIFYIFVISDVCHYSIPAHFQSGKKCAPLFKIEALCKHGHPADAINCSPRQKQ